MGKKIMGNSPNNKKGVVTLLFLVLAFVLFFVGALFLLLTALEETEFIGYNQLSVMHAYDAQQEKFNYLDSSMKIASAQTINVLNDFSGYHVEAYEHEIEEFECGEFIYPIITNECKPDIEESFTNYLEPYFYTTIANHPSNLRQPGYEINIEGKNNDYLVRIDSLSQLETIIYRDLRDYRITFKKPISTDYYENSRGYMQRDGLTYSTRHGQVDTIVMHYTVTTSADSTFNVLWNGGKGRFSYHYVIDKDGQVFQFVDENKVANHAGCLGYAEEVCDAGYNSRSIGISLVGCGYSHSTCPVTSCYLGNPNVPHQLSGERRCWEAYTPEQIRSTAELINDIIERHPNIRVDRNHIIGHDEINRQKSDPGPAFNYSEVFRLMEELS